MRINEVAAPGSLSEAIAFLKRQPKALPCCGCTRLLIDPAYQEQPLTLLALDRVKELQAVSRTDRFIDIGAATSLNRLLNLPNAPSLEPLKKVIAAIGSASVRNRASLGGNIAASQSPGSIFPILSCLEAAVELRSLNGSRWIGIHSLLDENGRPALPPASFITRIRIPIQTWDQYYILHLGDGLLPDDNLVSLAAVANIEKNVISEIHFAAAGNRVLRDRSLEMNLAGKRLPLPPKEIEHSHDSFLENAVEAMIAPSMAIALADAVRAFLLHLSGDLA